MIIVGIQCGHDASVAVLADGKLLVHLERERVTRLRHDRDMSADLIQQALDYCGLATGDVDLFAVCTTQSLGFRSDQPDRLTFTYDWDTAERLGRDRFQDGVFRNAIRYASMVDPSTVSASISLLANSEAPDMDRLWTTKQSMMAIDAADGETLAGVVSAPGRRSGHVLPMNVVLDGRCYPAVGVMHQLAHASAAFYQSGFEAAAVLSHDNGQPVRFRYGYPGGMLFHGEGRSLVPIWTAPIAAGLVYSRVAERLRLGGFAGPGKLMGLSAYGRPVFFDPDFVGDLPRLDDRYVDLEVAERDRTTHGWFRAVEERARNLGYAVGSDPLSPYGKDIAATAQKTFEELVLYALDRLRVLLEKTGRMGPNLCLSGGCALNCPANSRIVQETAFSSVFVPPSCDDGGLSIGAALYVYHHMLGHDRTDSLAPEQNIAAAGRVATSAAVSGALDSVASEFVVESGIDLAGRVAEDLAGDRVVALYQGRSESGPRALGHRSLLADPRRAENWPRVNGLKSRELWRPFAPACLSERLRDYFDGGPEHSPHMLFTYRVRSKDLPAVTHVDGSARTQTVAPGSGVFREVIEAFDRRTGVPVVLNTSLNGPGEPIVETPEQAIEFLRRTTVDAVYVENNRIGRRSDPIL